MGAKLLAKEAGLLLRKSTALLNSFALEVVEVMTLSPTATPLLFPPPKPVVDDDTVEGFSSDSFPVPESPLPLMSSKEFLLPPSLGAPFLLINNDLLDPAERPRDVTMSSVVIFCALPKVFIVASLAAPVKTPVESTRVPVINTVSMETPSVAPTVDRMVAEASKMETSEAGASVSEKMHTGIPI